MWGGASACVCAAPMLRLPPASCTVGVLPLLVCDRLVSGGENNETYFTCHAKQVKLRVKRAANIEEYILAPGIWDGAQRQDGIMGYKEPSSLFMGMCYLV